MALTGDPEAPANTQSSRHLTLWFLGTGEGQTGWQIASALSNQGSQGCPDVLPHCSWDPILTTAGPIIVLADVAVHVISHCGI